MCCLDIVRVIISPAPTHPFGVLVIRHDVAVIGELFLANGGFPVLLDNLAVQQFSHLCWRAELSISSWVMRIFDTLNAETY